MIIIRKKKPRTSILRGLSVFPLLLLIVSFASALTVKDVRLKLPPPHPDFPEGSHMSYNVSYGIFDVGILDGTLLGKSIINGAEVFKTRFTISSSDMLKKITFGRAKVWEDIYTYVDVRGLYSHHYFQISDSLGKRYTRTYNFDYKTLTCTTIVKNFSAKTLTTNIVSIYGPIQDGVSNLLYVMGLFEDQSGTWNIPTMGTSDPEYITVTIEPEIRTVEVHGRKLKGRYMSGRLHYTGLLGIEGGFDGYFHPEWPHWPIKSNIKIWLGSVSLYLTEKDAERVYRMQSKNIKKTKN